MSTPGGELLGDARIEIDIDTDPALRALQQFSRDATIRLRSVRDITREATTELRAMSTQADRIRFDVGGELGTLPARLEASVQAAQNLTTATLAVNQVLEALRDRAASATEAMVTLRVATAAVATSMTRLVTRARAADGQLENLDDRVRTLTQDMDRLGDATLDTSGNLQGLRNSLPDLTQATQSASDETDRFRLSLGALDPVLARVSLGIGALGAAAGSAVPLLAGVVTSLQNIAPAGAVAVTAMLAVRQASAAIQLGMIGVQDAVTAAFDVSAEGAAEFEEALERLSPSAREFALTVRELAPAFTEFQQSIQEELLFGFSDALTALSTSVFPVLQTNLTATATTLNDMALNAAQAASELAADGTLGQAMAGANAGLSNLSLLPAQVVTALTQLATAGAPAFDRLTQAAAGAATQIFERLGAAFESGALQDAVNTAIDAIGQLGTIAGNVFGALGNILGAAGAGGADTFAVLTQITQALEDATATEGFQEAMGALVETMGVLATTVGPLLGQALAAIGPVFTALAGPAQTLVTSLGAGLSPVIGALGPVLESTAVAVGALVTSLSPLFLVVGDLIASLLPPLVPLIDVIGQLFVELSPVIAQLGQTIAAVLAPVIASLPALLTPFVTLIRQVSAAVLPLAAQLLTAMTPALVSMGEAVAALAVAVAPLLVLISGLAARILTRLTPLLVPLIALIGRLAAVFAGTLAAAITNVVVPAIRIITSLFRLDFAAAGRAVADVVLGLGRTFRTTFNNIRTAVTDTIVSVVQILRDLGPRALRALGNLGSTLLGSGRALIQGFIDGMRDRLDDVRSAASALVGAAGDFFPGSPAKEGRFSGRGWTLYSGQATADAFAEGLRDRLNEVVRASSLVTAASSGSLPVGRTLTSASPSFSPNVTSNVSVGAPSVTVIMGNEVINDRVQVLINRNNATMARQLAQGVRR